VAVHPEQRKAQPPRPLPRRVQHRGEAVEQVPGRRGQGLGRRDRLGEGEADEADGAGRARRATEPRSGQRSGWHPITVFGR
jgi:hypothetical protein